MHVTIIGGKLQGVEAAYLAKKAGWSVTLVDKNSHAPARNLCDRFYQLNANNREALIAVLSGTELIIPALEDRALLVSLTAIASELKIPFAFDLPAYNISSSKSISNRIFAEIGIPLPREWPECGFPIIAKPSGSSGSENVFYLRDELELKGFLKEFGHDSAEWIMEEYLHGPSYSIEVIGCRGRYFPLQITALEMDDQYDCKRVSAPANLTRFQQEQFARIAIKIAEKINLNGVMDVEVILSNNELKVLEIDARLPSQTPAVVFHSTGINILQEMAESFVGGNLHDLKVPEVQQGVILEHIAVSPGQLVISGEHVISTAGPLYYTDNFFGSDEALTNYQPERENWVATIISKAENYEMVSEKRDAVIASIKKVCKIKNYNDPVPR